MDTNWKYTHPELTKYLFGSNAFWIVQCNASWAMKGLLMWNLKYYRKVIYFFRYMYTSKKMLLWTELVKNHTNLHNKYPFPFYVFPEQKYKSNDSEYLWKTCKRYLNTLCVCVCGGDVFKHLWNVFHAILICLSRQIRLLFYLFLFCIKLLFKQFSFKEVLQMVYTQMIFF